MTAFIHHLFRALSGYVQKWTKQNVPNDCPVLHDFGDGAGAVPAAPVDNCGVRNDIIKALPFTPKYDHCGVHNDIIDMVIYPVNRDTCGLRNDIILIEHTV